MAAVNKSAGFWRNELALAALVLLLSLGFSRFVAKGLEHRAPKARQLQAAQSGRKAERIVSLTLPSDELLLAMVDPSRIVALEMFIDDPRSSNAVIEATRVSRRARAELESILQLRPDLVFVSSFWQSLLGPDLERHGVRVHGVSTPNSLAEVRALIEEMGVWLGEEEAAARLLDQLDSRLACIEHELARQASRLPEVLLVSGAGVSPAGGTLFADVVSAAGGRTLLAEGGAVGYAPLPLETLLSLDPDIVLISNYSADGRARTLVNANDVSRLGLSSLRATREGQVFEAPPRLLLTTSHHVGAFVLWLAKRLHADRDFSRCEGSFLAR